MNKSKQNPDKLFPKAWKLRLLNCEESCFVDENTEIIYQEALYEAARIYGHEHIEVAEAATYLGDLYLFLGKYTSAESLYKRALRIYRQNFGEDHMLYSMALRNVAEALDARGKHDEAKQLRHQARGIFG